MPIRDFKTSLLINIFAGLLMTEGGPKHVAIL
jgi:hypothetical protein